MDRVHIDRVLQHVVSPARVIGEAARMLRGGGGIVCVEPDWATVVIDHPDIAAECAYTRFNVEHTAPHATAGYLTGDQGRSWLEHLDAEPFFASVALFVVTAQRHVARSAFLN